MLTPQEVSSSVFEKAVFGGYDIAAVDQFVEKLTKAYTELYRENETLKDRIRLLSERIEEYRTSDDAMRLALLSAKKAARDAEEKARMSRAEAEAATAAAEKSGGEAAEQTALTRAREQTAAYLQRFRAATAACEAALEELCGETAGPAEAASPEGGEAALTKATQQGSEAATTYDLNFETLNFGARIDE